MYPPLPLPPRPPPPLFPPPTHPPQSQSHGKIVRKLSKRLKVGSRKATMATMPAELLPMRPSSPVLYAARPTPLHPHSLLEQSDSGSSGNTANSLGIYIARRVEIFTKITKISTPRKLPPIVWYDAVGIRIYLCLGCTCQSMVLLFLLLSLLPGRWSFWLQYGHSKGIFCIASLHIDQLGAAVVMETLAPKINSYPHNHYYNIQ
jgi:hypothetical protein